jgi:hypothetical protein
MDPILNCLTGVCCPPDSAEQAAMATKFFMEYASMDAKTAAVAGAAMLKYFDLAEKGTLVGFKASIARLAKG